MFNEDDIVYKYDSKQAVEDGILVDITKINKKWKDGLFNYVTSNLLNKGYLENKKYAVANILDLLNQAYNIVKSRSGGFKKYDYFFCGLVELPSSNKTEVFIVQNDAGKYTIMLPEDY